MLDCPGASDGNAALPPISHDGRSRTILLPRGAVTLAAASSRYPRSSVDDEHSLMCVRGT